MNQKEERAYIQGSQAAHRAIIANSMRELTIGSKERKLAALAIERSETLVVLRNICKEYGDNNWPDDLHLTDILNKHLLAHLERKAALGTIKKPSA